MRIKEKIILIVIFLLGVPSITYSYSEDDFRRLKQGKLCPCCDLSGADLSASNLYNADLTGTDLSEADLTGANLRRANLSDANLRDADLTDADLSGANLSGAIWTNGVRFEEGSIGQCY